MLETTPSRSTPRYALNKNKYLIHPEYDYLHELLKNHAHRELRNCCLLFIALHTGARATEILNLKFSDLNRYDESLFIRGIKNSNDREIPLPSWLFQYLISLKVKRHSHKNSNCDDERIFPITYNRLRQIWQFYRPSEKKFHSLRHTFAIRLYEKTKDLRLVQVALGHRNITNTMIYADYVYSQQELRRLIL